MNVAELQEKLVMMERHYEVKILFGKNSEWTVTDVVSSVEEQTAWLAVQ
jgi:hypothetical protein